MGMVTVTVPHELVGQFLDICTDTIVKVQQDDVRRVCRFTLHIPEMASCEAQVLVRTANDGSQTAWLVPVVPSQPRENTIKAADIARMWRAMQRCQGENP